MLPAQCLTYLFTLDQPWPCEWYSQCCRLAHFIWWHEDILIANRPQLPLLLLMKTDGRREHGITSAKEVMFSLVSFFSLPVAKGVTLQVPFYSRIMQITPGWLSQYLMKGSNSISLQIYWAKDIFLHWRIWRYVIFETSVWFWARYLSHFIMQTTICLAAKWVQQANLNYSDNLVVAICRCRPSSLWTVPCCKWKGLVIYAWNSTARSSTSTMCSLTSCIDTSISNPQVAWDTRTRTKMLHVFRGKNVLKLGGLIKGALHIYLMVCLLENLISVFFLKLFKAQKQFVRD